MSSLDGRFAGGGGRLLGLLGRVIGIFAEFVADPGGLKLSFPAQQLDRIRILFGVKVQVFHLNPEFENLLLDFFEQI